MEKRKNDNFMMYVPRKKHQRWEVREDGSVYLIFPHKRIAERVVRIFVKRPVESDIRLDEVGSYVWSQLDGQKTVYEVGQVLIDRYGKSCEPVYERLILYLRYLCRRGWIAFDREKLK